MAQRLTPEQLQELTLGEALAYKAGTEPGLASEIKRVTSRLAPHTFSLDGIEEPRSILDMKLTELNDGRAFADFVINSPLAKQLTEENNVTRPQMLETFTRLNTVFSDANLNAGSGPRQNMQSRLQSILSKKEYDEFSGYKYYRARSTVKRTGANIHEQIRDVIALDEETVETGTGKNKKTVTRKVPPLEKAFLGFKYASGLRMEDMGSLQIENYDPVDNTMTFIEGKSGAEKTVVIKPAARPFLKMAAEGREKGVLFPNHSNLQKNINARLKRNIDTIKVRTPAGETKDQAVTMKWLRNVSETLNKETGMTTEEQLFAGGRTNTEQALLYVEEATFRESIDPKLRSYSAKIAGYGGERSLTDWFAKVGVPDKYVDDDVKSIVVARDTISNPRFRDSLSKNIPGFVESLPETGGGSLARDSEGNLKVFKEDTEVVQKYRESLLSTYGKNISENKLTEVQNTIAAAEAMDSDAYQKAAKKLEESAAKKAPTVEIVEEVVDWSKYGDSFKKKLGSLAERFERMAKSKTTKTILGATGVAGLYGAAEKGYSEELERSGSEARAIAAGAGTAAIEAGVTLPMEFMRAQPVGEGSDIVPTDEAGKPQYPFLDKLEADLASQKQGDDLKPDITVTYPRGE